MRESRAYIIAARRSALGRVGGLHKARRIEALAGPVLAATMADAHIDPGEVDEVIVGNTTLGGNPARLIALAAGCGEQTSALTIDRQCGSGLDAILAAIRSIETGDAAIVAAGGAESLSTAPWRIAKPKSLYQLPRFIDVEPDTGADRGDAGGVEAGETLARRLGIDREQQDAYALRSHLQAMRAREAKGFAGEIVPLKPTPEEGRDQSAAEPDMDELGQFIPFEPEGGTLTPGNTSAPHDGAAFVVVVSKAVYERLGRPPALRLVASASLGVAPSQDADAPMLAMRKLYGRLNGLDRTGIGIVEIEETSAAQAIGLARELGLDPDLINPEGGAVARGHPLGASGAVLVARLFSQMVRRGAKGQPRYGAAAQGALGGLGLAALFEAV